MSEQVGWDEHARYMDALVDDGFILLGGPLEGEREVLLIVDAPSEEAIRERLAADNWTANGMLSTVAIERWTIRLDGRDRITAGSVLLSLLIMASILGAWK